MVRAAVGCAAMFIGNVALERTILMFGCEFFVRWIEAKKFQEITIQMKRPCTQYLKRGKKVTGFKNPNA